MLLVLKKLSDKIFTKGWTISSQTVCHGSRPAYKSAKIHNGVYTQRQKIMHMHYLGSLCSHINNLKKNNTQNHYTSLQSLGWPLIVLICNDLRNNSLLLFWVHLFMVKRESRHKDYRCQDYKEGRTMGFLLIPQFTKSHCAFKPAAFHLQSICDLFICHVFYCNHYPYNSKKLQDRVLYASSCSLGS